jgi:hypothetical protein
MSDLLSVPVESTTLEQMYEKIKEGMEQKSGLENLNITTGATALIAMRLYSLSPYDRITLIDRLSGTCTPLPDYKIDVQLAKIMVGNELRGAGVFRQFEDCKGCVKTSGCDRIEAGSILFKEAMFTGYTNSEIAYKPSIGSKSGDCSFIFSPHLPSHNLTRGIFFDETILYPENTKNYPVVKGENPLDGIWRRCFQRDISFQKIDKIDFAVYCSKIIKNAYSLL